MHHSDASTRKRPQFKPRLWAATLAAGLAKRLGPLAPRPGRRRALSIALLPGPRDPDTQLWAVSHLRLRAPWLYELYLWLALPLLLQARGAPLLRLSLPTSTSTRHRELLLIIRNGTLQRCLEMLSSRWISLISPLRVLSTSRFEYSLMQRLSDDDVPAFPPAPEAPEAPEAMGVASLLTWGGDQALDVEHLRERLGQHGCALRFAGRRVAQLTAPVGGVTARFLPAQLPAGTLVVIQASEARQIRSFLNTDDARLLLARGGQVDSRPWRCSF